MSRRPAARSGLVAAARSGLVAAAAFAVGVWLGVTAGLATRAKRGPAR